MTTVRNLEAVFTVIDRSLAPTQKIKKTMDDLQKGATIPIKTKDKATADIKKIQGQVDGLFTACNQPLSITIQNHASAAIAKIGMELKALKAQGNLNLGGVMGAGRGVVGGAMAAAGVSAGMVAGAGVAAVAALTIPAAADLEDRLIRISKLTGMEGPALKGLASDMQGMMMSTGQTLDQISGAFETAGSAGIGANLIQEGKFDEARKEIQGFVEVSLQASSAFGMQAQTVSEMLSGISNVYKPAEKSTTDFLKNVGSGIDAVADATIASEEKIMTAMSHASSAMAQFKTSDKTVKDTIALSAALISTNMSGDQAGETIKDFYNYAKLDSEGKISRKLGMTQRSYQKLLAEDPQAIANKAMAKYAKLKPEEQGEFSKMFGMTGGKLLQLSGSANFQKGYADSQKVVNKAYDEGTKLGSSFNKSLGGFWTQLGRIKETFVVLAQIIGSLFLPIANALLKVLNAVIQPLVKFVGVLVEVFINQMQKIWDALAGSEFFKMLSSFFSGKLPGMQDKTLELIKKVLTAILDVATGPLLFTIRMILALLDLTVPIFKKIWEVLEWLYSSIVKMVQWLKDGLGITRKEKEKEFKDTGYNYRKDKDQWIYGGMAIDKADVPDAVISKYNAWQDAPMGVFDMSNLYDTMKTAIIDGLSDLGTRIKDAITGAFDGVVKKMTDFVDSIRDAIPGFAVGTPYVEHTGLALLHKGEAVIPASANNRNGGYSIVINAPITGNTISSQMDLNRMGDYFERRALNAFKSALAQRRT